VAYSNKQLLQGPRRRETVT